ncbi:hypothetical protein M2175_003920 [Bradyrhizobium elkanii]|nr:hypothetical protein [Bradyrhizobium elkanii]MCS3969444.1 hypothetical protein [Bradyrhizobium japonicum]
MSRPISTARRRAAQGQIQTAFRFYQQFEHIVVVFLTALIAIIVIAAVWNLSLKMFFGLILAGGFDPSDNTAFQTVFGTIFTVIIALEFKKSLLVVAERRPTPLSERNRRVAHPRVWRGNPCARHRLLADARQ